MEENSDKRNGNRPECEHCDKYAGEIAQLKAETEQKYKYLNNLCLVLNTKIDSVSKTVLVTAILTCLIALIGLFLCIGNVFWGCSCKHVENCTCIRNALSCWGITSIVLGVISFVLSCTLAGLGIYAEKHKIQIDSNGMEPTIDNKKQHKFKYSQLLCTIITIVNFMLMMAVILITVLC